MSTGLCSGSGSGQQALTDPAHGKQGSSGSRQKERLRVWAKCAAPAISKEGGSGSGLTGRLRQDGRLVQVQVGTLWDKTLFCVVKKIAQDQQPHLNTSTTVTLTDTSHCENSQC